MDELIEAIFFNRHKFKGRENFFQNSKYYCYLKFGPIYFVGIIFGVLPVSCNTEQLYFNDRTNTEDIAFKISKLGLSFTYLYLSINLFIFCQLFWMTVQAVGQVQSCMDEFCESTQCRNVCGHFILIWTNFLANFISIFCIVFYRRKETVAILNEINDIFSGRLRPFRVPWTCCSVVFFMLIQCSSYYLQWKMSHFQLSFVTRFTFLYLTQCLPIVTENAITVMLLALQLSYCDINRKLTDAVVSRPDFVFSIDYNTNSGGNVGNYGRATTDRDEYLKQLMRYHWKVTDTAERLSVNFQLDFLSVGFCSTVRFVYFLFLALKYLAEQPSGTQVVPLPGIEFLIFFVSVLGKFIYLCYRCDQVAREVNEFIDQVSCREVCFQAYGLFSLNLHLIFSVFGFTLTYFIVLLQLQVYHTK